MLHSYSKLTPPLPPTLSGASTAPYSSKITQHENIYLQAYIIPIDPNDEERTGRIVRALADEARLQRDLRAAGLL